nr:hypothetical protein BgiMline_017306 [Biomphalaria glabrata]
MCEYSAFESSVQGSTILTYKIRKFEVIAHHSSANRIHYTSIRIVLECPGLSCSVRDCPGVSGIVLLCPGLSWSVRDCPAVSGIVLECYVL